MVSQALSSAMPVDKKRKGQTEACIRHLILLVSCLISCFDFSVTVMRLGFIHEFNSVELYTEKK